MKLVGIERETHIWGNAVTDTWELYTADPKFIRKLEKYKHKLIAEDTFGKRFELPLHSVSIRRPAKKVMSEAHKAKLALKRAL